MGERTEKIDKSLKDADEIEKRLSLTEKEQTEIINAAKKQANLIIEEADKKGEVRREEMLVRAKEEIGDLMNAQRATIDRDKAETLKQIKAEVAELVVMSVEKVLNEKMDSEKDKQIIKDLVK
jgi:F-type H+-transporting ATPase subunit b